MHALEVLNAWNRACGLAVRTCAALADCPDHALRDVLTRTSLALPSTIAAACEHDGAHAFNTRLMHARAVCAELRTQLYLAAELDQLPRTTSTELMQETVDLARQLHALAARDTPTRAPSPPHRRDHQAPRAGC